MIHKGKKEKRLKTRDEGKVSLTSSSAPSRPYTLPTPSLRPSIPSPPPPNSTASVLHHDSLFPARVVAYFTMPLFEISFLSFSSVIIFIL